MADETASYPDSATLLRSALQQSWQRDRRLRFWRLPWRWSIWWLTRYGSSFIAAALVTASTPDAFQTAFNALPAEVLKLTPSYQINIIPKNP
jgi:hypothetical protein